MRSGQRKRLVLAIIPLVLATQALLAQVVSQPLYPIGDACTTINAAMQQLPASGGLVDARAFVSGSGIQNCLANPFIVETTAGTISATASVATVSGTSTGWTNGQIGGVLWCGNPANPPQVFLGVVQSVDVGTQTITLISGAATSCISGSHYIITAKSGTLLLGNATYSISAPWVVPDRWRVIGSGRGTPTGSSGTQPGIPPGNGTVLQANKGAWPVYSIGNVTTSSGNTILTGGGGATFTQNMVGDLFQETRAGGGGTVSATQFNASVTGGGTANWGTSLIGSTLVVINAATGTAGTVGVVATVPTTQSLTVSPPGALNTVASTSGGYLFIGPDQATVASFNSGTGQLTLSTALPQALTSSSYTLTPAMMQLNPSSNLSNSKIIGFGVSVSNLQVDCNSISGGVGIQNWWSQELSYVQDVNIGNCTGIGLDVETSNAMNSGPYANLSIGPGSFDVTTSLGAELLATLGNRGIHSITATANGIPNVGIDLSSQGITLEDAHLEGFVTGIEVGANATTNNATIISVTGGSGSGTMKTMVDISNNSSFVTSTGVNILGLSQLGVTNTLVDNILGSNCTSGTTTLVDTNVGEYSIGSATAGNRTRYTSSPNAMQCFENGADFSLGTATAATQAANSNDTKIATDAYVDAQGSPGAGSTSYRTQVVHASAGIPVTSTTLTPLSGLTFTLPASTAANYTVDCDMFYTQNNLTESVAFGFENSQPLNAGRGGGILQLSTTSGTAALAAGSTANITSNPTGTAVISGSVVVGSLFYAHFAFTMENPSTSANVVNIMASTAGGSGAPLTVSKDTTCRLTRTSD
jgi:hypothetical protein